MPIFCIFVQILHLNFLVQYSHRCAHCSHLQLYNSDASLFLQCLLQYGEDKLNVTVIYGSPYTFKLRYSKSCCVISLPRLIVHISEKITNI